MKLTEEPLELSIVVPCLNEAATLERCIRKAHDFLRQHRVAGEVVVGDNGSTGRAMVSLIGYGVRQSTRTSVTSSGAETAKTAAVHQWRE